MKKIKKIKKIMFIGVIIIYLFLNLKINFAFNDENNDKFDCSAEKIVKDIKIGWNLGNSLDRRDGKNRRVEDYLSAKEYTDSYEGLSNKVTTEEMIEDIKETGFNAIRVPVTWQDHIYALDESENKIKYSDISKNSLYSFIDELSKSNIDIEKKYEEIEKLTIESAWMDRVEEVVNWIIKRDMYCIINVHHDVDAEKYYNGIYVKPWILATNPTNNGSKKVLYEKALEVLWKQIANRFKDYNEKLLFEGFNEIRIDKETIEADENGHKLIGAGYRSKDLSLKTLDTVNDLNQIFVNTVRNTGGNNEKRFLIVNTYLAELVDESLNNFKKPEDIIKNHLILEVHYNDHYANYSEENEERDNTNSTFYKLNLLKKKTEELGMPAIIGEFGAYLHKYREEDPEISIEQVSKSLNYYVKKAKEFGISCFLWDDGGKVYGNFKPRIKTLNQYSDIQNDSKWLFPEVIDAIMKGVAYEKQDEIKQEEVKQDEIKQDEIKQNENKQYIQTKNIDNTMSKAKIPNAGENQIKIFIACSVILSFIFLKIISKNYF